MILFLVQELNQSHLQIHSNLLCVGVTGQGMATGDYFTVSNKTINGFDVAFLTVLIQEFLKHSILRKRILKGV